jgi:endonuclease YncB( thermonuclease family)
MKRLLAATLLVLTLVQAGAGLAAELHSMEVRVVGVSDGDTITVLDSGQVQHRVRLHGIDAPEKGQPFSERSKQALSDLVFRRTVTIQWSKTDRYGRILARVLAIPPDPCPSPCVARLDVNMALVDAGMAWHYKAYEGEQSRSDRKAFAEAELRARERHIGIWSQPDPVAPWERRTSER